MRWHLLNHTLPSPHFCPFKNKCPFSNVLLADTLSIFSISSSFAYLKKNIFFFNFFQVINTVVVSGSFLKGAGNFLCSCHFLVLCSIIQMDQVDVMVHLKFLASWVNLDRIVTKLMSVAVLSLDLALYLWSIPRWFSWVKVSLEAVK